MKTKHYSALKKPVPQQNPDTSLVYKMLTPSEIKHLRQEKKAANDYFQKVFSANKPKNL